MEQTAGRKELLSFHSRHVRSSATESFVIDSNTVIVIHMSMITVLIRMRWILCGKQEGEGNWDN